MAELQCRICLSPSPLKNVFTAKIESGVSCQDVMTKLFSLSVSVGDGLPSRVCQQCYSELSSAYKLKTLADRSYLILLDSILKRDERSASDDDDEFTPLSKVEVSLENKDYECDDGSSASKDSGNVILIKQEPREQESPEKPRQSSEIGPKRAKGKAKASNNTGEKKSFECEICTKVFVTHAGRYKHIKIEHQGESYFCPICKKHYRNGDGHRRYMHSEGNEIFECEVCQAKFNTAFALKCHSNSHSDEKPFLCPVCGKGFRTRNSCNDHKKSIHDQEKGYLCHYCSMRFFAKRYLIGHLRSHTKEYIHKCNECNKLYSSNRALNVHRKRHAGIKDVKCNLCEKSFVTNGALRKHMISHTKEKTFECKYCDAKFGRSDNKKAHERAVHKDEILSFSTNSSLNDLQ